MTRNTRFTVVSAAALFAAVVAVAAVPAPLRAGEDPGSDAVSTAGDVASGLPATVLLNLVLTLPVYALVRRLLPPRELADRVHEVRLIG